jgi:hypothetical protein
MSTEPEGPLLARKTPTISDGVLLLVFIMEAIVLAPDENQPAH